MSLARDWRIHTAIQLNRHLTPAEGRRVDTLRRDGWKLNAIIDEMKKADAVAADNSLERGGADEWEGER